MLRLMRWNGTYTVAVLGQGAKHAEGSRILLERAAAADERTRVLAGCTPAQWHALKRCGAVS